MNKQLLFLPIIILALTMQGCPSSINEPQDHYESSTACAYILSPKDTIKVRSYDSKENPKENTLYPSDYLQQTTWYSGARDGVKHSVEKHELHVKKLTSNAEVVVIEGMKLYINDELWGFTSFIDPSDTIQEWVNAFGEKQQIVVHIQPAPYELADVIEQLELHYPSLVHRLNDTEEHNFNNYQATLDVSSFPKIYIDKE